jgi:hypothetical protein
MLSRTIAIIVCFSLIGVTVLPASIIPCCCKPGTDLGRAESSHLRSCCEKAPTVRTVAATAPKSCCTEKAVDLPACCSKRIIKKDCAACRCLEQMQIVALCGYSVDQSTIRVPLVSMAALTSTAAPASQIAASVVTHEAPPGNPAFLEICPLRC